MNRIKPLYRYAGGKVRLLKIYHPFMAWRMTDPADSDEVETVADMSI